MWRAWIRHGGSSPFPDSMLQTTLQTKLEEDMFLYECSSPDCCCFHAALENVVDYFIAKYCSLCICKRYVYIICNYLTDRISINTECISGHHKPTPEGTPMKKIYNERIIKNALSMVST